MSKTMTFTMTNVLISDHCKYCFVITALVRSTTGRCCFHRCLSVHTHSGTPSASRNTSTGPMSFPGGTPGTGPRSLSRGYLSYWCQVPFQGVPQPGPDGGGTPVSSGQWNGYLGQIPSASRNTSTGPMSFPGGTPGTGPRSLSRGYLSYWCQVPFQGVPQPGPDGGPQPGPDGGVPQSALDSGMGTWARSRWVGDPSQVQMEGTPSLAGVHNPSGDQRWGTPWPGEDGIPP